MNRIAAVLAVLAASACGRSSPSSPDPVPTGSGPVISGVVRDAAQAPIAGARLEALDGKHAGRSTHTDALGIFTLTGPFDSPTTVRVTKAGYVTATQLWSCSPSSCNREPGPLLRFVLNLIPPVLDFAGSHMVTMSADPACADLPSAARTRTYSVSAVLYPGGLPAPGALPTGTAYLVQMSGASFHPNPSWLEYAYGTFPVWVSGDTLKFPLATFDGRAGLVEVTSSHSYVAFSGNATASVAPGASTISATFDGWIEFCARRSPMSEADDGYPGCELQDRADPTPSEPVAYARCTSSNHQIVFTRR
jgi:hypothetical protein